MTESTDRQLLFALLALQNNFVTRETLLAAFNVWLIDKSRDIAHILADQKQFSPPVGELLKALVEEHLRRHGNNPAKSLAALSSIHSVRSQLAALGDGNITASLAHVSAERADLNSLADTDSIGESTSVGTRFRILRPHARGGLGEVFVAKDGELNREVALKEIQLQHAHDPESRSRFTREAEITGGLEHPGIVPVYGLGTYADGRPFYAMRFIRGTSLADAIKTFHAPLPTGAKPKNNSDRNLELRRLLQRFIDVCEAIHYAHSRGVLHRDLKPGNIMLGRYGETLVVDWGLAKAFGETLEHHRMATASPNQSSLFSEPALTPHSGESSEPTLMGSALGTPAYMSPEQAQGRLDLLGPASDVFGLGATLYHLLTGRPPYVGDDLFEIMRQARDGDIPRPRSVSASIAAPLEAVCMKALATAREDRYSNAKAMAEDVEKYLGDEPIAALPESRWMTLQRWWRRHRQIAFATTLSLAIVSLITTVSLVALNRFRRDAESSADRARLASIAGLHQTADATLAQIQLIRATDGFTRKKNDALDQIKRSAQLIQQAALDSNTLFNTSLIDKAAENEYWETHLTTLRKEALKWMLNSTIAATGNALLELPHDQRGNTYHLAITPDRSAIIAFPKSGETHLFVLHPTGALSKRVELEVKGADRFHLNSRNGTMRFVSGNTVAIEDGSVSLRLDYVTGKGVAIESSRTQRFVYDDATIVGPRYTAKFLESNHSFRTASNLLTVRFLNSSDESEVRTIDFPIKRTGSENRNAHFGCFGMDPSSFYVLSGQHLSCLHVPSGSITSFDLGKLWTPVVRGTHSAFDPTTRLLPYNGGLAIAELPGFGESSQIRVSFFDIEQPDLIPQVVRHAGESKQARELHYLPDETHTPTVTAVYVASDGRILTGAGDGTVSCSSVDGARWSTDLKHHNLQQCGLTPDGTTVTYTTGLDLTDASTLTAINCDKGATVGSWSVSPSNRSAPYVLWQSASSSSAILATPLPAKDAASAYEAHQQLQWINLYTGEKSPLVDDYRPTQPAFILSPSQRYVVIADISQTRFTVWDALTRKQVASMKALKPPAGGWKAFFSKDEKRLMILTPHSTQRGYEEANSRVTWYGAIQDVENGSMPEHFQLETEALAGFGREESHTEDVVSPTLEDIVQIRTVHAPFPQNAQATQLLISALPKGDLKLLNDHVWRNVDCRFSSDGTRLLIGGLLATNHWRVELWDLKDLRIVREFSQPATAQQFQNGEKLAIGTTNNGTFFALSVLSDPFFARDAQIASPITLFWNPQDGTDAVPFVQGKFCTPLPASQNTFSYDRDHHTLLMKPANWFVCDSTIGVIGTDGEWCTLQEAPPVGARRASQGNLEPRLSEHGSHLVIAQSSPEGIDASFAVWDSGGKLVFRSPNDVRFLSFDPTGRFLSYLSLSDEVLVLHDIQDQRTHSQWNSQIVKEWCGLLKRDDVLSRLICQLQPSGKRLLLQRRDEALVLETGLPEPVFHLRPPTHMASVTSFVEIAPNTVISVDAAGEFMVWDISQGRMLQRNRLATGEVCDLVCQEDTHKIIAVERSGTIFPIKYDNGVITKEREFSVGLDVSCVSRRAAAGMLLLGTEKGSLLVVDTVNRKVEAEIAVDETPVRCINFSTDLSACGIGVESGAVYLVNHENSSPKRIFQAESRVNCLAFISNRLLVAGASKPSLIDIEKGSEEMSFAGEAACTAVAFEPANHEIRYVLANGTVARFGCRSMNSRLHELGLPEFRWEEPNVLQLQLSDWLPAFTAYDAEVTRKRGEILNDIERAMNQQLWGKVLTLCDEAASSRLANDEIIRRSATAYSRLADWDMAERRWADFVRRCPYDAKGQLEYGIARIHGLTLNYRIGDANVFDKAIELDKDNPVALYYSAWQHVLCADRESALCERARDEYVKACSLALERNIALPGTVECELRMCDVFERCRYEEAMTTALGRAKAICRDKIGRMTGDELNRVAWHLSTCFFAAARDGEAAIHFAKEATSRDQGANSSTLNTLAAAYSCAGNFKMAVETQRAALMKSPEAHRRIHERYLSLFEKQQPAWKLNNVYLEDLAASHVAKHDIDKALMIINVAYEIHPDAIQDEILWRRGLLQCALKMDAEYDKTVQEASDRYLKSAVDRLLMLAGGERFKARCMDRLREQGPDSTEEGRIKWLALPLGYRSGMYSDVVSLVLAPSDEQELTGGPEGAAGKKENLDLHSGYLPLFAAMAFSRLGDVTGAEEQLSKAESWIGSNKESLNKEPWTRLAYKVIYDEARAVLRHAATDVQDGKR